MKRKHFISGDFVCVDCETTGLFVWQGARPFAFSFCNELGHTAYFEWPVDPKTRKVIPVKKEYEAVGEFMADGSITKGFFNAKFDVRMLEIGMDFEVHGPGGRVLHGGRCHEVMFMAHACNSSERNFRLKPLAQRKVGYPVNDETQLKELVKKLRRRARKAGWNIAEDAEADYWLPATVQRLKPKWIEELGLEEEFETDACGTYAVGDAKRTMLLALMYIDVMDQLDVRDTYDSEMLLWPVTQKMERRGVCISNRKIEEDLRRTRKLRKELEAEIARLYGWKGLNLNSPAQVSKMLFVKNDVPKTKAREVGFATDMISLQQHIRHPAVNTLFRFRGVEKAIELFEQFKRFAIPAVQPESEFLKISDAYDDLLDIHSDFRQVGPATGRWSDSNPNLQQASSPEGSRHGNVISVRTPFVPRPGYVWLSVDYSGMEMRVFADVADEEQMLEEIRAGRDVHSLAVRKIYGGEDNPLAIKQAMIALALDGRTAEWSKEVEAERKRIGIRARDRLDHSDAVKVACAWLKEAKWDIEKAEKRIHRKNTRNRCKMVSFTKIYAGGANAAANVLGCPIDEAREVFREYDYAFPRVKDYIRELSREARANGYIRTRWNRRLTVDPDYAYRAVNYMVQGSSADLLKYAMLKCDRLFRQIDFRSLIAVHSMIKRAHLAYRRRTDGHILMPMHDELIFEILRQHCTLELVNRIALLMSDTDGHLRVSMPVDPHIIFSSWDDRQKIKGYLYGS